MNLHNEKGQAYGTILFAILLLAVVVVFTNENMAYKSDLRPIHEFLLEDYESLTPDNAVPNWMNYQKKQEMTKRLARLRPPLWKVSTHHEYLDLLDELDTMAQQVRPQTSTPDAARAGLAMMKGIDVDAMTKSIDAFRQTQMALRTQMLPKFKEKIQKLKELYDRLG